MLALKEFITFITHHKATLAQTYAQLLAERGVGYEVFPPESSLASARRVLNAVIAAYEAEQATPLCNLFDPQTEASRHRWHERLTPPQPMLEVECLGQTLTAVVTNLEAGKFLWQILAAARATMMVVQPTSSPSAPDKVESVKEILSPNQALPVTYTTLEFTFDNMPIVYLEWDLEGKITRWNKKATEIFGWTFTEALGSNIFELIVPGEYHDNVTNVVETIKGGVSHQNVNENVTKDGQRLLMEWYNELVRTRDEEIVGVASVGFDITERIAQEQQTQESLERRTRQVQTSTEVAQEIAAAPALAELFRRVVDLVQERFGYYHAHLYTIEQNDLVMQEGTGIAGRQLKEAHHKIPLPTQKSLVAQATRSGEPVLISDVSQSPDWLPNRYLPNTKSELSVPIKLGDEILGVLDVQSDMVGGLNEEDQLLLMGLCGQIAVAIKTRRIEDEREQDRITLSASEQRYQLFLDASPDPIVIYDDQGQVLHLNSAFTQTFGWSLEELHGRRIDFVPEKNVAETQAALKRLFTEKTILGFETRRLTKDGRILDVSLNGSIFRDERGNPAGSVVFVHDITRRKRTENILSRRATQLETVAKVSTAASTILEADKLFDEIVNLIRDQFDFYYVGLFLIDQAQQWAELWAGTGEAGRIQLERKHRLEIGGESMIGWSVAHRKARIALDVGAEAVRFQNPILPDTRSEMALPLVSRDEVIGALTVQSVKPGAFSDEDVTALQTMADQVANAIANVRLFELTQTALSETQASQERLIEYSEQLQQLQKITQKLARELEPGPEVYYEAIGAMADLLKARYAALALLDEAGNYNQFIHYGISDEQAKLMGDLPTGRGLLGALSREGQPIRIKNIQTDDRSVGFPAHHPDMKSLLGVPIIFQDKILGRLYFTEHHSGEFGADEQALVTSFASSLAGTLQAVKLFAQTQAARQESERQAYEANLLDKVNQVLITEPNLGAALHAVTESMVENFEAAFARLWVLDDTGQTLLLRASSGLYTHLDGGHAQVPVGKFKIGLIAEERQPHLTNDILNDPRLGDPVWAKQEGMVAFAGYPLLVGERLIGVLAMFARQPLPTETLTILGRLAERAAVAIDNRRLLEQTQRRAHRERILYEVSTNMRQSLNPETIIKTGLAVLGQELGQSGITIHLMPKGNGK